MWISLYKAKSSIYLILLYIYICCMFLRQIKELIELISLRIEVLKKRIFKILIINSEEKALKLLENLVCFLYYELKDYSKWNITFSFSWDPKTRLKNLKKMNPNYFYLKLISSYFIHDIAASHLSNNSRAISWKS